MTGLHSLWLPLLLSSVLVFVASSVIHMLLPWHKGDYRKVPDEDRFMETMRGLGVPPGDYMVPRPSSNKDAGSPQFREKLARGPVMMLTVLPAGPYNMARNLVLWFLYVLAVGVLAGYVAGRALPPGTPYLRVFRFAGVTAFIGYSAALWQLSIWYRRAWRTTIASTFDGLIYALLTAGVFGWLWPR